jgi:hypothetical protein
MRGEFIGVWSECWREIWSKLAKHPKAPNDLFSELYRELVNALIISQNQTDDEKILAEKKLLEIVSDPIQAKIAFKKIRFKDLRGERFVVEFFEKVSEILEESGGDSLANSYFNLLSKLIDKYNLRYDLRRPCCLHPTLPGVFASLMRDLKTVTSRDNHLDKLMKDFESAVRDLRIECSDTRIKACIGKQFILIEAIGSQHLNVDGKSLGDICDRVKNWPHITLRESLKKMYGFASDYPGIRHGGNSNSVLRDINMRDMVAVSILLIGFAPYLTELDTDIIYRGEL